MDILQEIAQRTKERIEEKKKTRPLEQIMEQLDPTAVRGLTQNPSSFDKWRGTLSQSQDYGSFPFEKALKCNDIALICEIKKASPSKGVISDKFPYLEIAREYESAGASAISVLTEPFFFKGCDRYLQEIAGAVKIPLLRKDFTVDSYMIYEAKLLGASAVLLICAISDKDTLAEYISIAHSLGLSALVEAHTEDEVAMALSAGARIIGINNRNLKTFQVDITLSERLRRLVPPEIIFVSESGITQHGDIVKLRDINADAALIGESLMKSGDITKAIEALII